MKTLPHKYAFSPSLLDAFQRMVDTKAEDFLYQDEGGGWHANWDAEEGTLHYSDEEVDEFLKREFIDKVNKVPTPPSEAACKGTALNEIVDCIIHRKNSGNKDIVIKSLQGFEVKRDFGCTDETGKPVYYDYWFEHIKTPCIYAGLNGFDFYFDIDFCKSVAEYFKGSLSQVYAAAILETKYGEVELHGYPDEVRGNKVFDLKTTSRYEFGKYKNYWQRYVYPYILIESGDCTEINSFEFTVYVLKGGTGRCPLITGTQYKEEYTYNHEQAREAIAKQCERLIEFLEANRDKITNKKIFGNNGVTDNGKDCADW